MEGGKKKGGGGEVRLGLYGKLGKGGGGEGGEEFTLFASSAANGVEPANISYKQHPKAHKSTLSSYPSSESISVIGSRCKKNE